MANDTAKAAGRTLGLQSNFVSKKQRRELIRAAGCEVTSDSVAAFEAGRTEGIEERQAAEAPEREAREAEIAEIRRRNDARNAVYDRHQRRVRAARAGEELHEYAARKQLEHLGLDEHSAELARELEALEAEL